MNRLAVPCVFLLTFFVLSCYGECPQIREWSRRDLTSPSRTGPAPRVIIRDRPGSYCSSISNCPTAILNLQSTDVKINNYPDIDCSVVVGGDGYVYEGRGWDAATSSYADSIVICVLEKKNALEFPGKYQKESIVDLLKCAADNGKLTSSYIVQTPRDLDSSSVEPVQSLYDWVKQLKNYSAVSPV
ncbi:peptidoglycan-recognition protein [Elysia marginata]|uniref:Peptidoglycan-recognition protein n=1 Tax=Elysia marginata TaxID=1093978 RepID=A0AAV4G3X5_9GAST|nr:peptidoglycan-recognition protein [Elysia marginata]